MAEHKPLYRGSFNEAVRLEETDQWRASWHENIACRDYIDLIIAQNYDGHRLGGDVAGDAIAQFGYDRVNWLLANTIRLKDHDGRFSAENKEWAKGFFFEADDIHRHDWVIDQSHPGLVDMVVHDARRAYAQLELFDAKQCISVHEFQDVAGHVLVLKPETLKDEHRKPENQLFLAEIGAGCVPTARGRMIAGKFLFNGEQAKCNREEFLGVLSPDHMPEWAIEKLRELEPEQSLGLGQPQEPEQTPDPLHIKLYQVNWKRDTECRRFENLNSVEGTPQVDASLYDEVFSGTVPSGRFVDLLIQFNNDPPPLHRGRSMARGDVIVSGDQCCFVDAIGFRDVGFDASLAHKRDDLLRVVVLEPGMPGYEGEIGPDIDSLQRLAGRYDAEACTFETLALLEAGDMSAWLVGVAGIMQSDGTLNPEPIFIVGDDEEGFCSLTDEQTAFFLEEYSQVEEVSMEEAESGMGMQFHGM